MQSHLKKKKPEVPNIFHVSEKNIILYAVKGQSGISSLESTTMSFNSLHTEMDNCSVDKKVLLLGCNSYWQENNDSVVGSKTSLKKMAVGFFSYFCLWKDLFVLMPCSSPSVAHHATRPCVVAFLVGKTKYSSQTQITHKYAQPQ